MSKATFTFGRFNAPTEGGHGKLISAVQKHADETGGTHYIFPSHSQDAKKNPLNHGEKVGFMRRLFPNANIVSSGKVRTAIDAMKHLEKKGHKEVTMVVGSDRVKEFHSLLNKYRTKEFPGIKKVNVVSAGDRDPDAEGAEGESASKHRGLVAAGKRDEFIKKYSDRKLGAEIHDALKKGMQMESKNPIGIFLLGGPGSGKDYVLKNIFSRFDLTEVQIDQLLSGSASELVENKKNIVINGAIDEEKIEVVKALLEGYQFDHVFVSVSNKISRERNSLREQPLPENKRIEKFLRAEKLAESVEAFNFNNSINLNESKEMERIFFGNQIEKLLERLVDFGLVIQEEATPKAFTLLREKKFPPVAKDKESGLPKKYVRGLSASTAKARKAHWKKMGKLSDSDPRAYEPAPGDATAKTKPSKHTLAVRKMMDEGAADSSLSAKAAKSGVSLSTLRKVYNRGVAAWNSGHRPGTTPQQWGHARVNSYINKGKTYHTADKDLREDVEQIDEAFDKSSPSHAKAKELVSNYGNRSAMRAVYHGDGTATIHTTGDKKVSSATRVDHIHDQAGLGYNRSPAEYKNLSKSKGGLKFKTKETQGKSIYGSHEIHISHKGLKEEADINELFEMQLVGTDEYRKHAIAMTPGQGEIEDAYKTSKSSETKEDCGCESDCECNEQVGTGISSNIRSFSELRKGIKEEKKEEVIDSTPTLNPKKSKVTSVGPKYYRGDLQGLPVTARFNALEAKEMQVPRQIPAPPGGHPVPPGYERVKSWGGAYELRKIPDWKYQKSVIRVGQTGHDEKLKNVLAKKLPTVKEAVEYHMENKVSFTDNIFRPGSEMFFEMISEAKRLYKEGKYTPADEFELDMLNSDIGEIAEYEGQAVVLDYPIEEGLEECWTGYTQKGMKKKGDKMVPNCVPVNEEDKTDGKGIGKPWQEGGGGAVYVRVGDSVRKVSFSKSGMKKKYMDPAATRSFVARHHCLTNKDKTSASYWACRWPRFFSNSGKTWW